MFRDLDLERANRLCVWVSGSVLALSALFKLISGVGATRILLEADPIFGITNRQLFFWVGALEIWVVVVLVHSRSLRLKLTLVAVLSTNFLLYRAGLWWLGVRHPCPCLGNAAAWTHADPKTLDLVIKAGLAWLLGSSYVPLLLFFWRGKNPARSGGVHCLNTGGATDESILRK
jgi:hypothetical protein